MISVYYNQKYGFLIVPNAIERFMGCYISIEPTIEIMAEETIDKIGCAIRKGIKIAESFPKVDESQLNNFWKQTKYKSFPTFSKNYQRIDLKQNGDELEIRRWERNNRGGYSRKTEEKDYINFIEMSDYELGLFIKKMFEPCEIRIDETERFETLEGKIISYSIPNEHYKNIGDGHTDSYMTYRNEDYDKLYISFLIGDGTDCTDEVSIKNMQKKNCVLCISIGIIVCILLSACSRQPDFDAKSYVQSSLDAHYHGEYKDYANLLEISEKDAKKEIEEDFNESIQQQFDDSDNITDKGIADYAEKLTEVKKLAKYKVQDVKEEDGVYTVSVQVEPSNVFQTLQQSSTEVSNEKIKQGLDGNDPEVFAAVLTESVQKSLEKNRYGKAVTVNVSVEKDNSGKYGLLDTEMNKLEAAMFPTE